MLFSFALVTLCSFFLQEHYVFVKFDKKAIDCD